MLVLVLTDNEDQTSNFVIDWLLARGVSVKVVVNDLFLVSDYVVSNKGIDFILETEGISLRLSEIMSYWHRRGDLVLFEYLSSKKIAPNKHVYLKNENDAIKTAILDLIYAKHGIGKIWENETNKISNLSYASSVGLKIPSTAISSSKYHLLNRVKNSQFCTKAINSLGIET